MVVVRGRDSRATWSLTMRVAFYKGQKRAFNRIVSWWAAGPYSHVEAIVDDAGDLAGPVLCASSSFLDGGVRIKEILLDPEHWDVMDVPAFDDAQVHAWFEAHLGDGYDLIGLLSTWAPVRQDKDRWFCNEAVGTAGGLREAWRFNPNGFAVVLERLPGSRWIRGGPPAIFPPKPASAGFLIPQQER
jgi:hypothetical protein